MARMSTDRLLRSPRRRGGKGRGYLVLLLAGVLGAGYLLWHRSKAPKAPTHALVVPLLTSLPRTTACWLETGRFVSFTGSALLIRHPRGGDILIDAGNSTHSAAEVAPMSLPGRVFFRLFPGLLLPTLPLPQALTSAGVNPANLKAVLISHLHPDHLGGVMDLPAQTAVWTSAEELAFLPKARGSIHGVPSQMDVLQTRGRAIPFEKRPYEVFDESADLFGDGSVVVVKLPGHTPGSLGIFVNLSPTRRLFYVGDAVNESVEIERGLGKHGALRITDVDGGGTLRTVGVLQQLHQLDPSLLILPAHDRAAFERAFGGGPRCMQ